MTHWRRLARATGLGPLVRKLRPVEGYLDGFQGSEITGWARRRDGSHVRVGAYSRRGLLAEGVANIFRADLLTAGIGKGDHSFCIPLSDALKARVLDDGGVIEVRTVEPPLVSIGTVRVSGGKSEPWATGSKTPASTLGQYLLGDFETLANFSQDAEPRNAWVGAGPLQPHAKLFAPSDYIQGGSLPEPMCAYGEYVRYRYKLDGPFPSHEDPTEVVHFLKWYLAAYGPLRLGLRTPMSADMIAHLNAPAVIPGQRFSLTQATWAFLADVRPLVQSFDFSNPDWVNWVIYWWAIDQAKALHCEDVLVPQHYVDVLAAIPADRRDETWPVTTFMERIHAQTAALSNLDLSAEDGRRDLTLALITMAARRPDFLRYIPRASVDRALARSVAGVSPFSQFLAAHGADLELPSDLDRDAMAAVLRLQSFDLDSLQFETRTPEGHRFEAARYPAVTRRGQADIQLIGPLEKASGLGQAARLSRAVLEHAGYRVNAVDFDLDNPAPEGFSKTGPLSEWENAPVNLIHLNAESIPLVYAYAPDVFSGAYNIGYFYWELDSPAACHFLALDLLDEIWVSTEYGVQIFGSQEQEDGPPVENVGMCYEDLPDLSRTESRAWLSEKLDLRGEPFVVLVAFDSFSFVQRKNPVGTVKAFLQAFDGVEDVHLVIKTQNRSRVKDHVQQKIWDHVDAILGEDHRVTMLDETLLYEDLLRLKQGSDCYVSLHKSEGWGFGMIEAMNLGVPVVATAYSGNLDFCTPETTWLVEYAEVELGPDDYIFVRPGQKWAEPDVTHAAKQLRAVYDEPEARRAKAEAARAHVREHFSVNAIGRRYKGRLDQIVETLEGV